VDQIYCGNAAQRLGSFTHYWGVGGRAGYQVDGEPDFRKHLPHHAERVGCGKNYLAIGTSRF